MQRPLALLVDAREPGALNLCRAFREAGHEVTLINRGPSQAAQDPDVRDLGKPSRVVDLYAPGRWRRERASYVLNSVGHKAAQAGLGARTRPLVTLFDALLAKPVQARLAALVAECGAEVVYGFWGVGSLAEQRALLRAGCEAAMVHQFQSYPLGKALQARPRLVSPIERATLGMLDGRIHASEEMLRWLQATLRPPRGLDAVLPEGWGSWACARERLPLLSEREGMPNVVHMGVPPLARGSHDDVRALLAGIAAQGVAVHAVEGFGDLPGLRTFPRMGLRALLTGEVATFMTQFDALALLYGAPPGLQWFAGNMPARFLSGLSAGIPVALPRGLFGAVERFVEQHGNGFAFGSPAELGTKLRDAAGMERCHKAALALQRAHRLERFVPQYQDFLERALAARVGSRRSAR